MTKIIDGKKIRDKILLEVKEEINRLPFVPVFCDVLVGDDIVSRQYVEMKKQKIESVGMEFLNANFKEAITTEELVEEINKINKVKNICGIIIQLPLPPHIDKRVVLDAVDPFLDVDSLGTSRSEKFYNGDLSLPFPTALACMAILDSINLDKNNIIDFQNKKVVVLGQGDLVGRPVSYLLKLRGVESVPITSLTEDKEKIIKEADIIISGIGKANYINSEMIKEGAILIDAGTSESSGSVVGDVDVSSVLSKASFVSPVPGGVGPVTIAFLLKNVLNVAKSKII